MIPKRPLLYLTSGLALAMGLIWFRRKKSIHCDTGGKPCDSSQTNDTKADQSHLNGHATKPIDCIHESRTLPETKLGKSAPIDINPNRISPIQLTDKQIDAEILKVKIQDTELKKLNSIEEQDAESLSPIDLPDSFERKRTSFKFNRSICDEEPIIVKAATGPKVSPKQFIIENTADNEFKSVDDSNSDSEKMKSLNEDEVPTTNLSTPIRNPPVSSPPLSLCSVQSNDSGKGSSLPHSEEIVTLPTTYEFLLPQNLTGLLLGYKGAYVKKLKSKTGATILIKRHPESSSIKICAIEGTQQNIDAALTMIRQKFPEKKYPHFTLQRVYFASADSILPLPAVDPTVIQLQLIEGINNDVSISAMLQDGLIFVQQLLHPSYPSLNILQNCMNQSYGLCESPMLPEITNDAVCVGCVEGNWYRVQIIQQHPDTDTCTVKYLDYGSYTSISTSDLRQIRADFMTVPFQSIECYLSNVKPIGAEWSEEAIALLLSFKGFILQAQIAGYTSYGTPEVYLFACISPNNVIFINKELVARNLATWIDDTELTA